MRVERRAVKSASWTARDISEYELPYGHVIAVATMQNLTECSHLAFPYFTMDKLKATYAPVVYPVGPQQTWRSPDWPLMIVRPLVMKTRPGRKSKHKRNSSRGKGSSLQRCSQCQKYGHSRNQCTESLPSQRPSGSQQVEATTTQQMDDILPSQRPSGS
ncbi:hypothetical protein OSB04_029249 [Centaurea solstitialis]|uniref:Uncharacterized protein n=1 Tax=Centaurea solstitialis TaxID=347529 RepID=A0AA38SI21_9ASTR|nr:hypothetical protein OSB04_029249 [Centaurea solstitialis]